MQHKPPIDQKKSIVSLLMIPHRMLKPQADYCIREVIGRVEYLAVCSKYIVGKIFVW